MGDRVDELKGNVKEDWGKLTGNERVEAEGRAEADKARTMRETKGAVEQAGGSVKEGVGQLIGDERLEAEGKADRLSGKAKQSG
ncbi:MAG TPA: CsbD family protein [Chloroflexota bacterium]|nr:CsbD family protein [Chloroflexota bacterium]